MCILFKSAVLRASFVPVLVIRAAFSSGSGLVSVWGRGDRSIACARALALAVRFTALCTSYHSAVFQTLLTDLLSNQEASGETCPV